MGAGRAVRRGKAAASAEERSPGERLGHLVHEQQILRSPSGRTGRDGHRHRPSPARTTEVGRALHFVEVTDSCVKRDRNPRGSVAARRTLVRIFQRHIGVVGNVARARKVLARLARSVRVTTGMRLAAHEARLPALDDHEGICRRTPGSCQSKWLFQSDERPGSLNFVDLGRSLAQGNVYKWVPYVCHG